MSVRVRGGAANQMRVEGGAGVTMVRRAYNEGGKNFGEGSGLLKAAEMIRDVGVEEVYELVKAPVRGRASGRSGHMWGRLSDLGSSKEASTFTHSLIMEARGISSVRACVVSMPGVEEGKSHRKISRPLDITEAWLSCQPASGTSLKRLPMNGRGRKTSAKTWKRYGC